MKEEKKISYSFFTPKKIYKDRFWDLYNNLDRYWYNIPALMAVNSVLYPDFKVEIQISPDILDNDKFILLKELSNSGLLSYFVNNREYTETQPTIWRYKPLFDKECDLLLCRDIDSLPTKDEYLATKYFNESEFKAGTIRSHTNHTTGATVILAGLCGFRPRLIGLNDVTFNIYYDSVSGGGWGLDQNSLISIFARVPEWTSRNFLDSRLSSIQHQVRSPLIPCVTNDELFYRANVNYDKNLDPLLGLLDGTTTWAGEPIDFRKGKLSELLNMNYPNFSEIKDIIKGNPILKDFYL